VNVSINIHSTSRAPAALLAALLALPLAAGAPTSAAGAPPSPGAGKPVSELRAAAAKGSAGAQYELAERLAVDGVDADRSEAVVWLERAAKQGHAEAQTHLSWALHLGIGVAANDVAAVKWERLAAQQGQASAQYYLGSDYEFGLGGLPKDSARAAEWYRRAAEQQHPIAQTRLGDLYATGRGVPRDDREAVTWYQRAAAQNDFGGQLGLGRMYAAGRGVPKDEKEALRWFERAADQEMATVVSVFGDGPEMSQVLRHDYGFSISEGRQTPFPGASKERDELAARLAKLQPPPPAAVVAKPEEFCPRLAEVMAAATGNFATLRGKASETGWEATEALPGMHSCTIERATYDDAPPFSYRCTVVEDVEATAASASREGAKQLLSRCLGDSWHAGELPHSAQSDHVAVFFDNRTSPILLKLSQDGWRTSHSLTLTVDAPLAPITLTRSRPGGAIDLDSPVDFKSEGAGLGNVIHAFAELLGADLVIGAGLSGKVTLDRRNVPLHEALDAACAQAGCTWFLSSKHQKPELYIERRKK
jgi:hypothetical protein